MRVDAAETIVKGPPEGDPRSVGAANPYASQSMDMYRVSPLHAV